MADPVAETSLAPNPEQRRLAAERFERATQAAAAGRHDEAIQLLLTCCQLDPANLIYRQALRCTERAKDHNRPGRRLALLAWLITRAKLRAARRKGAHRQVLDLGEQVLVHNPWHAQTQREMAEAAGSLGLLDLAVWLLEQLRQRMPNDPAVNRPLARLYEKRGNFSEALNLWQLVLQADPRDSEARHRVAGWSSGNPSARPGAGGAENGVEASLTAHVAEDPTRADAYLELARFYRRTGRCGQAREVLLRGLGPTGNAFALSLELADLDIEPFRRDLALTEQRLQAQPHDEELRGIQARLFKEVNSRELEWYRQKADRYPRELVHRLELGLRLLRAAQIDEAVRELEAARADPRLRGQALFHRGRCFAGRNNWCRAEQHYQEALHHISAGEGLLRKEILFALAWGAAEAGEYAKAAAYGTELADLDRDYREISRLREEWLGRLPHRQGPDPP
jgi:tetratricopeptide (TPR) repeat protein